MIIAVDFDGTLCINKYPSIGNPNLELIKFLKDRKSKGDELILWTCRVEPFLTAAIDFCKEYGLEFDYVNENSKTAIQRFGNDCRKIFADRYIDDKAVYCEYSEEGLEIVDRGIEYALQK